MADMRLVNKWIEKAREDFGFAAGSLEDESEFFAQICFHFQQAAEKYLKAYVVKFDLEFKKIHDLMELLDICRAHSPLLDDLQEHCIFLNRFYIFTRYPVHWDSTFTKQDALGAMQAAKAIADSITKSLC
ncbi:MAG: HEPN domain-containing protein [Candidatus Peribacteraceae bacterium]